MHLNDASQPHRGTVLAVAAILALVALAWMHSLDAPFVLDDHDAILGNASLRSEKASEWFWPDAARGETVAGRPVLNLSFIFNYALGGLDVRGYRLVNVLIHGASALLLFGIVRGTAGVAFGFAVAAVWAVHPLQTAAVTYVAQRAESLAGFWILLTMYAFARAMRCGGDLARRGCLSLSIAACFLGVATKETAAAIPLLVLLYDRACVSGSWKAAWLARRGYYLGLAASWLLLAWLVVASGGRGGSAGFDASISVSEYFFTQCAAVMRYLTLAFWPARQVFDYGTETVTSLSEIAPEFLMLALLAGGSAWALARNRVAGFLGASFFLLLAPSSSFVPIATQTIAEHRMYVALAPLIGAVGLGVSRIRTGIVLAAGIAVLLAVASWRRNDVYRSDVALWQDTVAKRPANPRAHYNLGLALLRSGKADGAMAEFRETIRLRPNHAFAQFQLGTHLLGRGEWPAASQHLRAALAADPDFGDARVNYAAAQLGTGNALAREGDLTGAANAYQEALKIGPPSAEAQFAWGNLLAKMRRIDDATAAYRVALGLDPAHVPARNNLANALLVSRRFDEAVREYEEVLRRQPDNATARANLQTARELQRTRR